MYEGPTYFWFRDKGKRPREAAFLLFLPYKFRIPSSAVKPANFLWAFWSGSLVFAVVITFVRGPGP